MFPFSDVNRINLLPGEWELIIEKINGKDSQLKTLIADDIIELNNISVNKICAALQKLKYSHMRKMNVCTDERRQKIKQFFTRINKQRLSKFFVFRNGIRGHGGNGIIFEIFGPC